MFAIVMSILGTGILLIIDANTPQTVELTEKQIQELIQKQKETMNNSGSTASGSTEEIK
tara:strand:- start:237 stop:413 length:177 start_codon:yes stop_codon:yes gene_type:complete